LRKPYLSVSLSLSLSLPHTSSHPSIFLCTHARVLSRAGSLSPLNRAREGDRAPSSANCSSRRGKVSTSRAFSLVPGCFDVHYTLSRGLPARGMLVLEARPFIA
jgi:hypothetical protein